MFKTNLYFYLCQFNFKIRRTSLSAEHCEFLKVVPSFVTCYWPTEWTRNALKSAKKNLIYFEKSSCSGILFALWPQSINFYFKLKNQKRAASKRPIVWKRHSKGIYVQVLYCTIFSLLKHLMDSHFMAYNCVWWRLRSTYPISKKSFAFVESVLKKFVVGKV